MDDRELVLVRSFEELRSGMRIVVKNCVHCDSGGDVCILTVRSKRIPKAWRVFPSCTEYVQVITDEHSVRPGRVFRFAADLGISDRLAREVNPYVTRSVVGTAGRDEVVIARKARAR